MIAAHLSKHAPKCVNSKAIIGNRRVISLASHFQSGLQVAMATFEQSDLAPTEAKER